MASRKRAASAGDVPNKVQKTEGSAEATQNAVDPASGGSSGPSSSGDVPASGGTVPASGGIDPASGGSPSGGADAARSTPQLATQGKQSVLMISPSQPFRPKQPDMDEITSGRACSVRKYATNMFQYVSWKFASFLYDDDVIQLRHPLYASKCPPIDNTPKSDAASGAEWRPTSIMEPMDMTRCVWALNQSGIWEGAVSIWNFDTIRTEAFGVNLDLKDPSWPQFLVLKGHWSMEVLTASHGNTNQQRYLWPSTLLSFVHDVSVLEEKVKKNLTLRDMPASGGHAVCWSFFAAIDEALEAGDKRRLRLLWEVSNQVTLRLRLNPTTHQLVLDRLTMADQLRVQSLGAGVQSFFELCVELMSLPELADGDITCPKLLDALKTFGITYKGKPVDKTVGHAMLAAFLFAKDSKCREAVRFLDRVDPKAFDDHTKVMRCCQRIKTCSSFAEHQDMFVFALECMAVSLLSGDTKDASIFTVDNLAGNKKGDAGYVRTAIVKKRLIAWFLEQVSGEVSTAAAATVTPDGYLQLRRSFTSPHQFFLTFARARTHLEQEKCSLKALVRANLDTLRGTFKGLAEPAAMDFLSTVCVFEGDEEAEDIAKSGMTFATYFGDGGSDGEGDVLADAPPLKAAYCKYRAAREKARDEAPVGADVVKAEDDEYTAIEGDEESELKARIYNTVMQKRGETQKFPALRTWQKSPWTDGAEATTIFQRSSFAASGATDAGKKNKIMLFNPALYQCKETFASGSAYKENVVWRAEMGDVFQWMLSHHDEDAIVAAFDARNPKIWFQLQKLVNDHQKDETKYFENHILYKGLPLKDDVRFAARKVYGALVNVETIVGVLPVSRVRMITRDRNSFSACGEKTTYTRTYSGVPWRTLSSLPRMTQEVKDGVTGMTSPTYEESIFQLTRTRGHPLFWRETVDVEWYMAFYKDAHATHIFDVSPGSGAAAIAAAVLDISYEGVALSPKHAVWLENIMDKAIFAALRLREIPTDAKGKPDAEATELRDNVLHYFKDLVEEGRKYVEREDRQAQENDIEEPSEEDDGAEAAE